jgi:exoribonuclease II
VCALQDRVNNSVNLLNHLARILRQRRIDAGALTLASPEVRFKLDSETQNPTDVAMYSLKESNALVEEWMLLANITVSKQILKFYPTLGTVSVGTSVLFAACCFAVLVCTSLFYHLLTTTHRYYTVANVTL